MSKTVVADRARMNASGTTDNFFDCDELRSVRAKVLDYVAAGVAVNLSGPAGVGKTTMAMEVSRLVGRPTSVISGNSGLMASDFIGKTVGASEKTVIDDYIHSVRKKNSTLRVNWGVSILEEAMKGGHTLIYDEFTRVSPEANSTLLSVLEERVLICADPANQTRVVKADPNFRIILTSNPFEYVGVMKTADAFLDRVLTVPMEAFSPEAIANIVMWKTGVNTECANKIVEAVACSEKWSLSEGYSLLRTSTIVAKIIKYRCSGGETDEAELLSVCAEVMRSRQTRFSDGEREAGYGVSKVA